MKLIVTGPAGAGKGSLAKYLAIDYNIPHISTGDIFRKAANPTAQKYINQGLLVPDDIVVELIKKRLREKDCENGYIFDGFPRTLEQAKLGVAVDYIINIIVTPDTVLKRLGGRYVCKKCGQMHNVLWHKIDACRDCGGELYQRDDDREEIILRRLEQHNREFKIVLDWYRAQNIKVLEIESKIEFSPEDIYRSFIAKYGNL